MERSQKHYDFITERELSLLEFQWRVLAQAEMNTYPVFEQLRFLCIVANNLDEFFEIRVAGIKEHLKYNKMGIATDDTPHTKLLKRLHREVYKLVGHQYHIWYQTLLPRLKTHGIHLMERSGLGKMEKAWVSDYFFEALKPILTPIALDAAYPFPKVFNKSFNFIVELEDRDTNRHKLAMVQVPRAMSPIVEIPGHRGGGHQFLRLSSVLREHMQDLFPGRKIKGCYPFRVTRNSDLWLHDEDMENRRRAIKNELVQRQYGDAVRLEVTDSCPASIAHFLLEQFGLKKVDLYQIPSPLSLNQMASLPDLVHDASLIYPPFTLSMPEPLQNEADIFKAIRQQDILLHHPYQSFNPTIELIRQAVLDPDVLAIKITIYRTGNDSTIMNLLIDAAKRGKEVMVVLELMARFDEEANINWAEKLELSGAHVAYGVMGMKTHSKVALIVRREQGKLEQYGHISTGNYHQKTALLYTDMGLLTHHAGICNDIACLFEHFAGLGKAYACQYLWQSPHNLHSNILQAIENEAAQARAGKPARLMAKMNSLGEPQIVRALYQASQDGVRIDLIVRGICVLTPNVKGLSENITVCSTVGRFLEHSRIFYFYNGGAEDTYLSSADWMPRNFFHRMESCVPVLDAAVKARVIAEGLLCHLENNSNTWRKEPNGHYRRPAPEGHNLQQQLLEQHCPT